VVLSRRNTDLPGTFNTNKRKGLYRVFFILPHMPLQFILQIYGNLYCRLLNKLNDTCTGTYQRAAHIKCASA
jgi:hypothetical protein